MVPVGIIFGAVELGVTEKADPLQACVEMLAIIGEGFTVIISEENIEPEQLPLLIKIYGVKVCGELLVLQ